jgi:hypothetical protein
MLIEEKKQLLPKFPGSDILVEEARRLPFQKLHRSDILVEEARRLPFQSSVGATYYNSIKMFLSFFESIVKFE